MINKYLILILIFIKLIKFNKRKKKKKRELICKIFNLNIFKEKRKYFYFKKIKIFRIIELKNILVG
jgi:hypothetical protein